MRPSLREGHRMFLALRQAVKRHALSALDLAGTVSTSSLALVSAVTGRLLIAAVLAGLALGFFLRLSGRRAPVAQAPPPIPPRAWAASAVLSLAEVAALTEATNLPVRFDQPGFQMWHWVVVLLALVAAFVLQAGLLRALMERRP
jgi:hypothetical protein